MASCVSSAATKLVSTQQFFLCCDLLTAVPTNPFSRRPLAVPRRARPFTRYISGFTTLYWHGVFCRYLPVCNESSNPACERATSGMSPSRHSVQNCPLNFPRIVQRRSPSCPVPVRRSSIPPLSATQHTRRGRLWVREPTWRSRMRCS